MGKIAMMTKGSIVDFTRLPFGSFLTESRFMVEYNRGGAVLIRGTREAAFLNSCQIEGAEFTVEQAA